MKRILIAEDDPATRFMLQYILQNQGYEVTAVEDGEKAWECLSSHEAPRMAILDWLMPGLDGLEVCRRVRAAQKESYTYLMLLTARDRREDILSGLEAGADDYIVKPIDAAQMQARLNGARRILHLHQKLLTTTDGLRKAKEEVDLINSLSPSALFTVNPERKVVHWNRRCEEITGLGSDDVLGRDCPFLEACADACGLLRPEGAERVHPREILFRHPDGTERLLFQKMALLRDARGEVLGATESFEDLTERKRQEERIHFLSFHDPLTGLPNRMLLQDRLTMATASARRAARQVALLFIGLDRFTKINDVLGHCSGDNLLRRTAERLSGCLRVEDSCGRIGGDEFAVVLPNLIDATEAAHVAQRIQDALARPFLINGREITLTASIGISIYPDNGEDFDTLLQNAGLAKNQVKEGGRNDYHFFTPTMNVRATETLNLEIHLRRALEREEFSLVFQPQVCLSSGEVVAAEALLRWRSPELGEVPPNRFIAVAEERGLILPLGEWVMRNACRQNRLWQAQGLAAIPVAVNVSAVEFHQARFPDKVLEILKETGMEPRYLELEVTEGVVMLGADEVIARLHRLKEMGILLAMDDFGTGYSSLSYLRRFPFDKVKVDCSFVRDLDDSQDAVAITRAILGLAKTLKMETIAEGVETGSQLKFLREEKCDVMQGYYFSRPLPPEEFAELLRQRKRLQLKVV